jgi:Mce-associated membrane protein
MSDDPEHTGYSDGDVDLEEIPSETTPPTTRHRWGLIAALLIVAVLAGLVGWLGFRYYQSHAEQHDRALFLQVGRQAAINLTTIDNTRVEADVQRILDSSTGTFHDDFQNRAQPFIAVVKQVQSTTEGTITEAGLESAQNDAAQVLVAVSVKTSNVGAEQPPRAWRMRISVQKIGSSAKVSNVEFVP